MAGASAGTFRRLAAATYDGLLLLAALMLVTALLQLFTHGEAITRASVGAYEYAYCALLLLCVAGYYAPAWTRRGQTLGMKAWNIRVETEAGDLPTLGRSLLRLLIAAPLYLLAIAGVLVMITHRGGPLVLGACLAPLAASFAVQALTGRGTLHDRLSRTRVMRVAPAA